MYSLDIPSQSQQEIVDNFCALWSIEIKRRTLGDILIQEGKCNVNIKESKQ